MNESYCAGFEFVLEQLNMNMACTLGAIATVPSSLLKRLDSSNLDATRTAIVIGLLHGSNAQRQPAQGPKDKDASHNTQRRGAVGLVVCAGANVFLAAFRTIRQNHGFSRIDGNVLLGVQYGRCAVRNGVDRRWSCRVRSSWCRIIGRILSRSGRGRRCCRNLLVGFLRHGDSVGFGLGRWVRGGLGGHGDLLLCSSSFACFVLESCVM